MGQIQVIINGIEKAIDENSTVHNILEQLEITNPMVVVEKNLEIVPKENYDVKIQTGDSIEVLTFFGGG